MQRVELRVWKTLLDGKPGSDFSRALPPWQNRRVAATGNSSIPGWSSYGGSWLEPIVRMWRFSKSNGITEGFHTKMEMLSRRAYGFRNFENYRLRVLAQCGWNGVINRV